MIHIRELRFSDVLALEVLDAPDDGFLPVEKINLFVGPNNAGKSRLLRAIFSASTLRYRSTVVDLRKMTALAGDLRDELTALIRTSRYSDVDDLLHDLRRLHLPDALPLRDAPFVAVGAIAARAAAVTSAARVQNAASKARTSVGDLTERVRRVGERHLARYRELTAAWLPPDFVRVYVPTLRGARVLGSKDVYLERTRADYFPDHNDTLSSANDTIFTGQNLYSTVRDRILGDSFERDDLARFARLLAERLFHQTVTIVASRTDGLLTLQIGNRSDRAIHELGDGIQQIVIMLFAAWFHRHRDLLLFIDEPELFLHPALQRTLIEIFADDTFPRTQIFTTTHSNHILDRTTAASRASIFMMPHDEHVEQRLSIRRVDAGDRRLLEALGVLNSSVFLTNCTIWIEGMTDRLYLKRYLQLVGDNDGDYTLVEDVHYSFFEYAGSNLEHWSEVAEADATIDVTRLCARQLVIADSDAGKDQKHDRLRSWLGERYVELPCREIENLLSEGVLRRVVEDYEKSEDNIVKAPFPPFLREPIGSFIDRRVLKDLTQSVRYNGVTAYADRSGTVKTKVEFARRAVSCMDTIDALSTEAIAVTRLIRRYIIANNLSVLAPRISAPAAAARIG